MNKCYVYIIGVKPSGPIKIGFSTNCRNRLSGLQTGFHLKLQLIRKWDLVCSNAMKLERAAHRELKDSRLNGEWFSCSPEVAIATILAIGGRTKGFRNWTYYKSVNSTPLIAVAATMGGKANAKRAGREFWERFALIKDRWHTEEKSEDLLKEAGIRHHDTVRSYLTYTRWEWRRLPETKRNRVLGNAYKKKAA